MCPRPPATATRRRRGGRQTELRDRAAGQVKEGLIHVAVELTAEGVCLCAVQCASACTLYTTVSTSTTLDARAPRDADGCVSLETLFSRFNTSTPVSPPTSPRDSTQHTPTHTHDAPATTRHNTQVATSGTRSSLPSRPPLPLLRLRWGDACPSYTPAPSPAPLQNNAGIPARLLMPGAARALPS